MFSNEKLGTKCTLLNAQMALMVSVSVDRILGPHWAVLHRLRMFFLAVAWTIFSLCRRLVSVKCVMVGSFVVLVK